MPAIVHGGYGIGGTVLVLVLELHVCNVERTVDYGRVFPTDRERRVGRIVNATILYRLLYIPTILLRHFNKPKTALACKLRLIHSFRLLF